VIFLLIATREDDGAQIGLLNLIVTLLFFIETTLPRFTAAPT
jgi:hypothetical protein